MRQDYSEEVDKHRSLAVRIVLAALGTLFVVVGVIGVFVPVLPTTPFLLLAAACYARASTRFYNWLLNSPGLGPIILEWRRHRSIPYRVKLLAIGLMALTLGGSIVFFVESFWAGAGLTALGGLLAAFLWRIPSRDRPRRP